MNDSRILLWCWWITFLEWCRDLLESQNPVSRSQANRYFRPRLEGCEERLTPASYLWSPVPPMGGMPAITNWSNPQGWVNEADGERPMAAPGAGDSLVFAAGHPGRESTHRANHHWREHQQRC